MKLSKILATLVVAALFSGGVAFAAAETKSDEPKSKTAACCTKASEAGKDCAHACCTESKTAGKNCTKCGGAGAAVAKN